MNKTALKISALIFLCLILVFGFINKAKAATTVYLDPSSVSVAQGSEFEIKVSMDSGSNLIFGADALVIYPTDKVELVSITNNNFFPDFSSPSDTSTGTIEIHAYVSSLYEYKSGSGQLATIKFKAKQATSGSEISLNCSGTTLINNDLVNILDCNNIGNTSLVITTTSGGNTGGDTGNNSTGGSTADNTYVPGEPNSCGGTCGSNENCKSNYFCFEGYCRNPLCSSVASCDCSQKVADNNTNVITSTIKKITGSKSTPKPTAKPTPELVSLRTGELVLPTLAPTSFPEGVAETTAQSPYLKYLMYALGIGFVITLIVIGVRNLKNKNKPPTMIHPENI